MRDAETALSIIREREKRGLSLKNIYRLLYNPELYLWAYARLYSNDGAMTKGTTNETVDAMSLKKSGKLRPLGLPIWAAHYPSFQAMFGIPWVLLLVDRELRFSRPMSLPGPFDRLA